MVKGIVGTSGVDGGRIVVLTDDVAKETSNALEHAISTINHTIDYLQGWGADKQTNQLMDTRAALAKLNMELNAKG